MRHQDIFSRLNALLFWQVPPTYILEFITLGILKPTGGSVTSGNAQQLGDGLPSCSTCATFDLNDFLLCSTQSFVLSEFCNQHVGNEWSTRRHRGAWFPNTLQLNSGRAGERYQSSRAMDRLRPWHMKNRKQSWRSWKITAPQCHNISLPWVL